MTVRNCMGDEGRPFEVGDEIVVEDHRKLLSSKAMVVSIAETSGPWLMICARQMVLYY